MNVVLVVLDSLSKDCIGAYGQPFWGKVHTPHLDAFAEQSVLFERAGGPGENKKGCSGLFRIGRQAIIPGNFLRQKGIIS